MRTRLAHGLLKPWQERMVRALNNTRNLRYLGAESVRFATGTLAGFRLWSGDAQPLGRVNGVLIDPATRQLRYFVIETPGLLHRRYLLRADTGATIQPDRKMLQIDARRNELDLESFNAASVRAFSDEDLLETLFSRAS